MFKILLVILLAAPVIGLAVFLFVKARNYCANQNRIDKYNDKFTNRKSDYYNGRSEYYNRRSDYYR